MLAIQLKNYLSQVPDDTNVLIFTAVGGETRQLLFTDIDRGNNNIVIDAEYTPTVKKTIISPEVQNE